MDKDFWSKWAKFSFCTILVFSIFIYYFDMTSNVGIENKKLKLKMYKCDSCRDWLVAEEEKKLK